MRIARTGLAAVKGTRHRTLAGVDLTPRGPAGDRRFAVVDPARAQVLRTVANPSLVAVAARWDGDTLTVDLDGRRVTGRPGTTGRSQPVDYWGRRVRTAEVAGPWSAAFSEYLGRPVVLTEAAPADVVYGAGVSLVTTGSLRALTPRLRAGEGPGPRTDGGVDDGTGCGVAASRFRATFVVDTAGTEHDRPGAELAWVGRVLRIGAASVRVTAVTARCAVVDVHPVTGHPDLRLLAALPRDVRGTPVFGVEGDVVRSARVTTGDPVVLAPQG